MSIKQTASRRRNWSKFLLKGILNNLHFILSSGLNLTYEEYEIIINISNQIQGLLENWKKSLL